MKRLVLVALAACTDYAHVSTLNAPGDAHLLAPLPHENGDPARFEPATDPGTRAVALFAMPYVTGGIGRYRPDREGSGEVGLELRAELERDAQLSESAFAATFGIAFAQWGDNVRTLAPGPFYVEANYRFLAKKTWPIDVGVGPAYYVDDSALGIQATVRVMFVMLRTRFVTGSGGEVFVGGEIPIPFIFAWSK